MEVFPESAILRLSYCHFVEAFGQPQRAVDIYPKLDSMESPFDVRFFSFRREQGASPSHCLSSHVLCCDVWLCARAQS